MGNDFKYGIVLGGVLILIFVGYLAMRDPSPEGPLVSDSSPITTEPDMFEVPRIARPAERPPQTMEVEIAGAADEPAIAVSSERVVTPVMPGIEDEDMAETFVTTTATADVPEPAPVPTSDTYVIKEGDRLSTLAKRFYGRADKWQALYEANKDVIPNANVLKVGTEIVIPDLGGPTAPRVPVESETPVVADAGHTHKVAEGDTLYTIAVTYYGDGNRWQEIYDANKDKMRSPNVLKVGMVLDIP